MLKIKVRSILFAVLKRIRSYYRICLYIGFRRKTVGVIKDFKSVNVEAYREEFYKNDVLHPCIRYSNLKVLGYNWWMVYTPYYGGNEKMENPILCYGVSNNSEPPLNWNFYKLIRNTPFSGYNSDPNLLLKDDSIVVIWREHNTPRTIADGSNLAVYALKIWDHKIEERIDPILAQNDNFRSDGTISPTLIEMDGLVKLYCANIKIKRQKNDFFKPIVNFLSLLELYSNYHSLGVLEYEEVEGRFMQKRELDVVVPSRLLKPWHYDFFMYQNVLYTVVLTNKNNGDLYLGKLDNNRIVLYPKPLITGFSIRKKSIYKGSVVLFKDHFYLYFTAKDMDNNSHNKLFVSSSRFDLLLEELESKFN